tara:strand:+ start:567 stop:896 length:330 start_codon:yes stop_codon:yes gene_type:complete
MENQTISPSNPKFKIVSARVSGVYMENAEVSQGLQSGELTLKPGDVLFLDSGMNPEDTLTDVQTYASDKYSQYCAPNAEVSADKIKICETDDENICVAFRKTRAELIEL